jgi:hypothetical protein
MNEILLISTVSTVSWEITSVKGKEGLLQNGSEIHLGNLLKLRPKINSQKVYGMFFHLIEYTLISLNRFLHKLYILKHIAAC